MLVDLSRDEIATAKLAIEREMKTHSSVASLATDAEREGHRRLYYKLACCLNGTVSVSPELHNDLVDALENTTAALRNALASPELQSAMLAADLYGRSKTLAAAEAVLIRVKAQSAPHTALPRFEIEPQRDDLDGAGSDETRFVPCSEDVAQIFAVFERVGPAEDDFEWIGDFSSRPKAEAWIAAQPDVVASANR